MAWVDIKQYNKISHQPRTNNIGPREAKIHFFQSTKPKEKTKEKPNQNVKAPEPKEETEGKTGEIYATIIEPG